MATVGRTAVVTGTTAVRLDTPTLRRGEQDAEVEGVVIVQNTAAVAVRIGGPNVTATTNGILLAASTGTATVFTFSADDSVWAASASAGAVDVLQAGQ